MFPIKAVNPNTNPMLAMLEPTTLLIAIAGASFKAALRLTKSSGIDVAKDTTVIPITNFEMLSLNESATEDLTKNSPPTTKSIKPKISQTTLMKIIFLRRYNKID